MISTQLSYGPRMHRIKRLLLTIAIGCYSAAAYAQLNISVDLKGINGDIAENVRLFLSIEQQKSHSLLSEARLQRLNKKAPQEITNALQPFGYYRPVIESSLTQVTPNQWLATYTINPGPPLRVGLFDFVVSEEMKNDPEFKSLIERTPLHKGDVFNHLTYESVKSNLANLAAERGYFTANFTQHRVEIDLTVYEARIYLHYDGGPRYHFGDVSLKQNVLNDDLLKRYIPFKKGSPYSLNQVIDLQQALNDSEYFKIVEVSPGQPQVDTAEVPITVKLEPRKRNQYTFGVGYGTDTGARTKFGWAIPRVNESGHRFSTEAKISELGYSLSAQYRVPVLNPRTDQMIYSIGEVNEKTNTSDSTIRTVGAALNRNHNLWRESVGLSYQQEEYIISTDRGNSTLLIPSVNWSRSWGNDFINTIDGLRFDIGFRGASKNILSDTDFFQAQAGIKAITPLGADNRMITRGRLGATWTQDFHQLPASVRFFTGGSQSVRGYDYQSLGPRDSTGKVIGGKNLMIGSIEFEHSFSSTWGAAVFYDAGNAIDDFRDNLARGAGIGLRWKSLVGTIRIDVANAISQDGHPWRLHINIGPDL